MIKAFKQFVNPILKIKMPMPNNNDSNLNNNASSRDNNNNNDNDPSPDNNNPQERFVYCEECDIRIPDRDIPAYWTPIFCLYCPDCCRFRI
jgi:hypothetical protein